MTPSPTSRDTPIKASTEATPSFLPDRNKGRKMESSTMVPPSPPLLRLMARQAYSTVTSSRRVQMINERMPIKFASVLSVIKKITASV